VKSLLKKEGFFATDLEGTESDSSEMSECGEWGELAGGHDDVFSRCRSALVISGPIWGIMLLLLMLKMGAAVLKHNLLIYSTKHEAAQFIPGPPGRRAIRSRCLDNLALVQTACWDRLV
jgi:hypothetical protein